MLKSDPELIHFDEVGENESDRVLKVTAGSDYQLISTRGAMRLTHHSYPWVDNLWSVH